MNITLKPPRLGTKDNQLWMFSPMGAVVTQVHFDCRLVKGKTKLGTYTHFNFTQAYKIL